PRLANGPNGERSAIRRPHHRAAGALSRALRRRRYPPRRRASASDRTVGAALPRTTRPRAGGARLARPAVRGIVSRTAGALFVGPGWSRQIDADGFVLRVSAGRAEAPRAFPRLHAGSA